MQVKHGRRRRGRAAVHSAATSLLVAALSSPPCVHAAVVECVDARGVQILTSDRGGGDCLGTDGARPRPQRVAAATPAASSASHASPTFPRVDGATQRTRDDDRTRILRDELDSEQQRLVALQTSVIGPLSGVPDGDRTPFTAMPPPAAPRTDRDLQVARTLENIRALKNELARAR